MRERELQFRAPSTRGVGASARAERRAVILVARGVLTPEELAGLREQLRTARFTDGRASAEGAARERKQALQLDRSGDGQREPGEVIARALLRHPLVQAGVLPKSLRHPQINRYEPGMAYGPHLDAPIMRGAVTTRTDVSCTVFLSDASEYGGGELLIDSGGGGEQSFKAAAGDAVLYPSGALHQVAPVTAGARLVAVTWFESMVRDPQQRQILFELGEGLAALEKQAPDAGEAALRLRASYQRLMRLWLDT